MPENKLIKNSHSNADLFNKTICEKKAQFILKL